MDEQILVIDDNSSMLTLIKKRLEKSAYRVFPARGYVEALVLLERENIQLVLTDQEMPEFDGMQVLKEIKRQYGDSLPVIMVTSHTSLTLGIEFMKAGGNDFVTKPINFIELEMKIRRALQETHLKLCLREEEIAQMATKKAAKLKEVFVATISHQLRTPLTVIGGYTNLLGKSGLNQRQLNFVDKAKTALLQLESMVNEMLELILLEYNVQLCFSYVDIGNIVKEILLRFSPRAEKKGIKLEAELAENISSIITDAKRLKQVLEYLVDNAIKYTDIGIISIIVVQKNNEVQISVRDSGLGIDVSEQEKVFAPFEKIQPVDKPEKEGIGLGLYISKFLVEFMNGKMWVESELDKGSEFFFSLPIAVTDEK